MAVKTDCFAYDLVHKDCNALSEMCCKDRECKFYKSKFKLDTNKIEQDIKNYSINKK